MWKKIDTKIDRNRDEYRHTGTEMKQTERWIGTEIVYRKK
jgi:hypothetical protein